MVLGLLQLQGMGFSSYGEQGQWLQCRAFSVGSVVVAHRLL